MNVRSPAELREAYPDLLEERPDPLALRIVRGLDAGYSAADPPPRLWISVPQGLPGSTWRPLGTEGSTRHLLKRKRHGILLFLATAVLLLAGAVLAASSVVNLGKPTETESTNPYFPLSGFHRIGTALRTSSKPELLFIGTQPDPWSAMERWPVVKALDQFGNFSNVKPSTSRSGWIPVVGAPIATFDLSHARYRSRYIAFVHRDMLDLNLHPFQGLSSDERGLYYRYARAPVSHFKPDPDHVLATVFSPPNDQRKFPLILIAGYLQTVSQLLIQGEFVKTVPLHPNDPTSPTADVTIPFDTIQNALVQDQDLAASTLVENINAEANIITALICRADGKQPASVCTRPVIKSILKHVK